MIPNSVDDILREGARFNSHPGTTFWLDLAPYSSLPSYQAAIKDRTPSRQLTMMPCDKVLQALQEEYAAVHKFIAMAHGRQAIDSHAEALLSHVQLSIAAGQSWFQQHQTTASLHDILVGSKQRYSFSQSAVSAIQEICKDVVQGRCEESLCHLDLVDHFCMRQQGMM